MNPNLCVKLADRLAALNENKGEVRQAIARVLEAPALVLGPEVDAFEAAFARWLGVNTAVGVASGTDALALALRAAGVEPGARVVVDALAGPAPLAALVRIGAIPVRVDVEPETLTLAPQALKALLAGGERSQAMPRAVLATHRDGHPADLAALGALCAGHGLALVEDCTDAVGAALDGRRVGCTGLTAAFCFGPERSLGALGRAGLVTSTSPEIEASLRHMRDQVFDCPLDALQAAVLRAQLRSVDGAILRRQSIALRYDTALAPLGIIVPTERSNATHAYCRYVIRVSQPQAARAALTALGLGAEACAPFGDADLSDANAPVARQAVAQAVALPVYPQLPADHQRAVITALATALGR
ncbi:DegT/DnrJ/EryC1/StrS family aminotransferase [Pararhodospirillum oryzae]|uniref:UDP-2-acetamido-2-deoxy-alpha-D-ribo-hexopyranos-3-ulose 3-aminotransferase n=1 Tax=Pararhodospirillum oryzae TaxID=478448 RepID=A0A512H847_9PROT|nr:DegT/DnrJ/EryC1/StrS aminotransferase family protein [Pararhodospirillum oryzae]GEO81611.1 UDP-2-acetamido-2-deoxy-alpha-D-ribo-hexopyranos- 3-ulose 3-aminotransferase [Pararhodospirillum oryzae]